MVPAKNKGQQLIISQNLTTTRQDKKSQSINNNINPTTLQNINMEQGDDDKQVETLAPGFFFFVEE